MTIPKHIRTFPSINLSTQEQRQGENREARLVGGASVPHLRSTHVFLKVYQLLIRSNEVGIKPHTLCSIAETAFVGVPRYCNHGLLKSGVSRHKLSPVVALGHQRNSLVPTSSTSSWPRSRHGFRLSQIRFPSLLHISPHHKTLSEGLLVTSPSYYSSCLATYSSPSVPTYSRNCLGDIQDQKGSS
jgi:hypothetical protein